MMQKIKNIIIKLLDNPIGRLYLGVPEGKHIYKITKNSVHYYTGEIAKNGLPIICTGSCFSGSKNIENKILKLSKIVSCITFLLFIPKVLLPLIALLTDTGTKSPSATGGKYNQWTNPTYGYADDSKYAVTTYSLYGYRQSYENFNFSIPSGSTINGIEVSVKGKTDSGDAPVGFNVYNTSAGSWATEYLGEYGVGGIWNTTESTVTYGSSSYLWDKSWTSSDFTNANFSAYITSVDERSNIWMLNHITVKVYYTVSGPANVKTYKGLASASVKTCKGLAIASVKTKKGLN